MGDGWLYHTPNNDGNARTITRVLALPSTLWPFFWGTVSSLVESANWLEVGDVTPDEISQAFALAFDEMSNPMHIGTIFPTLSATIPPWALLCDGEEYAGEDFPELFAILPESLLVGSDSFRTPDLREYFLMGSSVTFPLGEVGGEAKVSLTIDQIPAHNHTYTQPIPNIDVEAPGAPDLIAAGVGPLANTGNTGGGGPHNNLPPFMAINWAIVAR